MPRTPWREAIDGKVAILRALRSRSAFASIVSYFTESESYASLSSNERRRRAERSALTGLKMLAAQVTNAEPYAITYDIQEAIVRTVNQIGSDTPPLAERALARTFAKTNLPSQHGFIWLDHPTVVALGGNRREGAAPGVFDAAGDQIACVLRAILFMSAYQTEPGSFHVGSAPPPGVKADRQGIALTAFLDTDPLRGANPWGGSESLQGIIPLVLPYMMEGDTLGDHMEAVVARYGDNAIDETSHAFPTMFLFMLFEMMAQKILLWGGSGLERDARKAAERNGLKPIVQVVTWRKAEYRYPEGHIPLPIDWSCRWPVKEHVRRYKNGKSVVIKSHVKGPPGKPLKDPNQRVNLVRR